MSIRKTYAVLGLGRYGTAVAKELADSGAEVLAVDVDEDIVNHAAAQIPFCKCANITDPEVFAQLGIPMEVMGIALAINAITDFPCTAGNVSIWQLTMIDVADSLNMLDKEALRRR